MNAPLQIRRALDDGPEVYVQGGWCYLSHLRTVGAVLADGRDPRGARELGLLAEDSPGDIETLTEFGFDSHDTQH